MKLFRDDNTEGYSPAELNKLNSEWEKIVIKKNLEEYTEEYDLEASWFSDQVSRR